MSLTLKLVRGSTEYTLLSEIHPGDDWRIRLWQKQRTVEQLDNGHYLDTLRLVAYKASSNENIIAAESAIRDLLRQAAEYATNPYETKPVWFYDYANGETSKRAIIFSGTLKPDTHRRINWDMTSNIVFYNLILERGPYESLTEETLINDEMGYTNYSEAGTVKGTLPGRISQLKITGKRPNYETSYISDIWFNIAREPTTPDYKIHTMKLIAASEFGSDTTISGDHVECSFATVTTNAKRLRISLQDALEYNYNKITNGGAENGDLTGWTEDDAGFSASSASAAIHSGSYGFYTFCGTGDSAKIHQDVTITYDSSIMVKYSAWYKVASISGAPGVYITFKWLDTSRTEISTFRTEIIENTCDWTKITGIVSPPSNAAYIRTILEVSDVGPSEDAELAVDDIQVAPLHTAGLAGQYLILARVYMDTSSMATIGLSMHYGHNGETNLPAYPAQTLEVTSSSPHWRLLELGVINIPQRVLRSGEDETAWDIAEATIEIWAEVFTFAGTNTLKLDELILLPGSHRLNAKQLQLCRSEDKYDDTNYHYSSFEYSQEANERIAITALAADFAGQSGPNVMLENWYLPVGFNKFYLALQQLESGTDRHNKTDLVDVTLKYFPRYAYRNDD